MKISIIKSYGIESQELPSEVYGSFWLDYNNSEYVSQKLISINAEDNKWKINSDIDTKIVQNNQFIDSTYLEEYKFYFLKTKNENNYIILYCTPDLQSSIPMIGVADNSDITIGKSINNNISINNALIPDSFFHLEYKNNGWFISNISTIGIIYVNNEPMHTNRLKFGDIIFLMGARIIVMKNMILIDGAPGTIQLKGSMFSRTNRVVLPECDENAKISSDLELYSKGDYFFSSPRLKHGIERLRIIIDPPPAGESKEKTPLLLTIGPMLTMGLFSAVSGYTALNQVMKGTSTLNEAMPSLVMSGAMLLSMILWPLLSKRFENISKKRREKKRQTKYRNYLSDKRIFIKEQMDLQIKALLENFPSFDECKSIIDDRKIRIWERKISHDDFLELRLGLGKLPIIADIDAPEERFSLDDDNLRTMLDELIRETSELINVPITIKMPEKRISAIIGDYNLGHSMIDNLLVQMMAFHSYEDLKIVLLTNEKNKKKWEYLKKSPHLWDNDKNIRFFASNSDDLRNLSVYLESVYHSRRYKETSNGLSDNDLDYKSYRPYFVVITDDFKGIKDLEFIKSILSPGMNIGFSLLILSDKLSNIPNECNYFIYADKNKCGIFEDELIESRQKEFFGEFPENYDLEQTCIKLLNIPIEFQEQEGELPDSLGFLEMYQVGRVEQLNSLNRWKSNNPTTGLQTPVGISKSGELFKIDLHEKFHGPHGLIAGGTGSGKSEFIITFILSMAVNYHPYEVSFVLIDYKGGGLAGVFENRETNVRLPHLAGTITNLDVIEMNRALASIQSELKKRQKMFNEVRDSLGESSVDIYKYQRLYREGKVEKPLSHLFIISDEFAELKSQQPDFMDQLISTARIGRSLGVHLILATQKPSGVVDDQIWSNSKFRVCLKVQEKADSIDMIKVPDAADIKNVGRFYLQVGYNEFFDLGQSAYCGGPYVPSDKPKKKVDNSITFVNDVGSVIEKADNEKKKNQSEGEEVTNILKYLIQLATKENISVEKLWLDKIPSEIFVTDLKEKYNYKIKRKIINPVIGEYDDPSSQRQDILTLPLSKEGNTIIYGIAGSGKENLLSTIIYSTIIDHDAKEVNFYILDFGSESLKIFNKAPQVADVVLSIDNEKMVNLFKLLNDEVDKRKKLFADYNGDFNLYCKNSGNELPLLVVIINGYENFLENYEDYEDQLVALTREGKKYGIVFIISTSSANGIRYRLAQNFTQQLVLQFNDPSDYSSILGNTNGVQPSKIVGRGIVKLGGIYEFQVAYPYQPDSITDYIKIICDKLREEDGEIAKPIPVLPENVNFEVIKDSITDLTVVPVGINKNSLKVETYDFKSNYSTIITANDLMSIRSFIEEFIKVLEGIDVNFIVLDAEKLLSNIVIDFEYYNNNFKGITNELLEKINKQIELTNSKNNNEKYTCLIIIGINKLIKSIENDINVEEFLTKGKDTENHSIIFVDSADNFKNYEYENWYKTIIDSSYGIWIGEGSNDQYTVKITKNTRLLQENISSQFGYVVKRGNPNLVKLLDVYHE